ncbi:S24 family peptidase [Streptomyces sp. NPDC093089]|uniref:S24 family peptidase n=1 Tax=Streptomyces sp. NPDC093089 TaxID=3366024 RepID=UPI00382F2824
MGRLTSICHDLRMGALNAAATRVAGGATVTFRPSGSSMVPLIRSRQQVVVAPVDPTKVTVGDIVLARVAGTVYLHVVSSVDPARRRVQTTPPDRPEAPAVPPRAPGPGPDASPGAT